MAECAFGTDGVRGVVGEPPITPDLLVRLGYAIGVVLGGPGREVVIAKDTRLSGYMVESAIEAGLVAAGIDTALTGPLPTPAVAHLVAAEGAAAGIVISASHNPYRDNGVKVFDAAGSKLSDEQERAIEEIVNGEQSRLRWAAEPGKARRIDDATDRYVAFCRSTVPGLDLSGLNVVCDAANGAGYQAAPAALRALGATVREHGCEPDGTNINAGCGALHPQAAAELVTREGCDLGIVLDGDGDRLQMITAAGRVLDGDAILHALSSLWRAQGRAPAGVVGTVMSNQALADALAELGVGFERSDVGDRNVAQRLRERGWNLGGEPAGHILILDRHITGDGLIAALAVLAALAPSKASLAEASASYEAYPAVLQSIACGPGDGLYAKLAPVVEDLAERDGVRRAVLRPSGTEPVLRLLVEARDLELARAAAADVVARADAAA
ncbi:MAG: phosphoglucosamine mutase [Betaproteobacteria bacterium AqS2]|uniref:Phosphoglucosamine mutase n=1 Tax=Candidatus Amphirhobacter heronislandensis TaxID=1732024 RepID=A0A930XY41_9GAMM|nr:phosphoglucosamine mutase [Betaproteobacteria bacterium AqS2]